MVLVTTRMLETVLESFDFRHYCHSFILWPLKGKPPYHFIILFSRLSLPFPSFSIFSLATFSHFRAAESPCRLIPSGATRLSRSSAFPNASADRDRWRPFKRSHGSVLFLVLTTPAQTQRHAGKRTLCTDGVGPAGVRTQT